MPITTDGKEPDLNPFSHAIVEAVETAIKKAQRAQPKRREETFKSIIFEHMLDAISGASGGFRAAMRQVYYEMRRTAKEALAGRDLQYGTFESNFTDYENEYGDVSIVFRDNRGVLYEPWSEGNIQVGTLMVEKYTRPVWRFNKLLFIEKEGFFEALKETLWPEIHDCALLTSKGFAIRAAKDLIDYLARSGEPIKIFCAHDADSAGTLIYETLQEATRAREARSIEIVDLGLQPWEAEEMGLESESFEKKEKRRPVAEYVKRHPNGAHWTEWLQSNRYELNAMTMPQFLTWLTEKVEAHDIGKVIPPQPVVVEEIETQLREHVREAVVEASCARPISRLKLRPLLLQSRGRN